MVEIRIDNTGEGTWWLYNRNEMWKNYVGCGNFDEEVALFGNRDYKNYTEANWYQKTKEILNDIDCYDEYPEDLSPETNAKLKELYDKCRSISDIVVDALRLLYPNDTFKSGTIYGYSQNEWMNYITKGNVNIDLLEAYFFGKVTDITVTNDEEELGDVITHDELWKEEDNLEEYFRKRYKIPESENIHILKADGYKKVIDWQEVC